MELLRNNTIIPKNTEAYLSTTGYYGYYYRDRDVKGRIYFTEDVLGQCLTDWKNEQGWKAVLLSPEILNKYPSRPCNVVWVKE